MTEHRIDWSRRGDYMLTRHGLDPVDATDAINDDPDALWLSPDPASNTGRSVRVIAYSRRREELVTVILVSRAWHPAPGGAWWGANGWPSSARDRRWYGEETRS